MKDKIRLLPTCSPGDAPGAAAMGVPFALASYGIWKGRLYNSGRSKAKFSVMCIDGSKFSGEGSHRVLTFEIIREALVRGCGGVLLDLASSAPPSVLKFCSSLAAACAANSMTLYLPERFAAKTDTACALIRTALCAGSLESRLKESVKEFTPQRLALDIELLRADFTVPSPKGAGRFMTEDELKAVTARRGIFYSEELAVNYSVCFAENSVHLILYDDRFSLSKKLQTAEALGIKTAFLRYEDYERIMG